MAIVKRNMKQIEALAPKINRKLMVAATEALIRRHAAEDGENIKAPLPAFTLNMVKVARARLEMTQQELAALTKIPVATLRNWEQGRTAPDAAATALFKLLARNPAESAKALRKAG
jgi:putative transcriptional regulator